MAVSIKRHFRWNVPQCRVYHQALLSASGYVEASKKFADIESKYQDFK